MFFAFSVSPEPKAFAITALPPTPIMVASAMMILNTGLMMETDATLAVSPNWAIKNISAIL